MCVKILLADDAEAMNRSICNLLSHREGITVVGEATTFQEVIQKILG